MMRKTKIVCTLGPATEEPSILAELLQSGMNVARFNMAHGTHDYHAAMIKRLREASRSTGIPVALLIDIKGPEVRTGIVPGNGTVELRAGSEVVLTVDDAPCTAERVSISYMDLPDQAVRGMHILIADGLIDLEVSEARNRETRCVVQTGGPLGSHKNVNIIGVKSRLPAVTEKDVENLRFAVRQEMDFVAASFVRKPEDILEIRQILLAEKSHMHIIAKTEDQEGVENIDGIIRVSDGIMVARGDLGVQMATEEIPLVQKRIILKCHDQNKAVITATQMLDSMIHNPRPTRAEATDVANAIFDGSDAVMLSGETASGKYPAAAVQVMDSIARTVEESPEYESRVRRFFRLDDIGEDIAQAVTRSAFLVAREIRASAIIAPTLHGNTPRLISKYRPSQAILAVTPSEAVQRRLLLFWGVHPLLCDIADNSDMMVNNALAVALEKGLVRRSEKVVIVAGMPVHSPIMLNTIKVHFIGNVLAKGERGFGGYRSGKIVRAEDSLDAELRLKHDDTEVLLTRFLTPDFLPLLKGLRGIILEESSYLSPEQIRSVAPDIAAIGSVPGAMSLLEDGFTVTLHGVELVIYEGILSGK
ncbi:MAG: pyruvate kinase [Spirochaetia bacterium]|jgi:pyruvate kinase